MNVSSHYTNYIFNVFHRKTEVGNWLDEHQNNDFVRSFRSKSTPESFTIHTSGCGDNFVWLEMVCIYIGLKQPYWCWIYEYWLHQLTTTISGMFMMVERNLNMYYSVWIQQIIKTILVKFFPWLIGMPSIRCQFIIVKLICVHMQTFY